MREALIAPFSNPRQTVKSKGTKRTTLGQSKGLGNVQPRRCSLGGRGQVKKADVQQTGNMGSCKSSTEIEGKQGGIVSEVLGGHLGREIPMKRVCHGD